MAISEEKLEESLDNHQQEEALIKKTGNGATEENKGVFKEILAINKENHRLLKKIVRRQRWATVASLVKILIFVVPLIAAYMYLPPLLNQVMDNYRSAIGTVDSLKSATQQLDDLKGVDSNNIDFVEQLKQMKELLK